MPDDIPVPAAYAFLAVVAFLRGGATYVVGRLARRAGSASARAQRVLDRPGMARAQELVARWGAPVVTLSFLTVGFQTLVNLSAGVLEMPPRRYVPALVAGALLWAALYVTIGLAVIQAWVASESGLWLLGAILAGVLVVGLTMRLRQRTRVRGKAS